MSVERHRKATEIFLAALKLEGDERERYIADACNDDAPLREEVESLLREDAAPHPLLGSGALEEGRPLAPGILDAEAGGDGEPAPERIASYSILGKLGEGGMGAVYEALQENPRRKVALKVTASAFATESMAKRFEEEARILGLLQHPGIARIYEAGAAETPRGRLPYFAMELIEGEPITAYAKAEGLSPRERLELLARVCDAVHYAHQRGIIHRDLKPGNILVDRFGEPKILDFGIARITDPELEPGDFRTRTGQLLGTLSYMSPEQAAAEPGKVDHRSDIYSLGVILHELLTGALPHDFGSMTLYEALRVLREEEPSRPGRGGRTLRGDLETIVFKALEKDRERRYRSAAELAGDIRRHLREEPILARAPSTIYRLRKFARRHKVLAGALAALFIGVVVTSWLAVNAMRAESRAIDRYRNAKLINDYLQNVFESLDPRRAGADARVADLLDKAAEDLEAGRDLEPAARAALLSSIGMGYHGIGRYDRAEPLLREALDIHRRELGEDAPEVAESYYKLGCVLQRRGNYPEAEKSLEDALRIQKEHLGESSLSAGLTIDRLGVVAWLRGDAARGEKLLGSALDIHRRLLGPRHPRIVMSLHRLGTLLSSRGERDRAEERFLEALEMARSLGPEDSLDVALVKEKLADHYTSISDFARAEPLLAEIAAAVERKLGPDHPDLASALHNRAQLLTACLREDEAAPLAERALEIRRKAYPGVHKEVGESLAQMGSIAYGLGDLAKAEEYFRAALANDRELYGPNHSKIASLLNMSADIATYRGRFDEALEQKGRAMAMYRELGMGESPGAARVLVDMGIIRQRLEEFEEAERLFRASLAIYRRTHGTEIFDVYYVEYQLGGLLGDLDKEIEEAERLLRHAYSGILESFGPSIQLSTAASHLGRFLNARGRHAEAESILREALSLYRERRPENRSQILRLEMHLGRCLAGLGKFEEAEPLIVSYYNNSNTNPQAIELLIQVYDRLGRAEKVRELRSELEHAGAAGSSADLPDAIPSEAVAELPLTLVSEPFQGDGDVRHALSHWEVRRWDASYERDPIYAVISSRDLTSLTLPRGLLLPGAAYRWRVLHVGSDQKTSGFLAERSFATGPFPLEIVPVDLSRLFNRDVIADAGDPENDFFDGDNRSLLIAGGFDGIRDDNPDARGLPSGRAILVHRLGDFSRPNALQLSPEDRVPARIDIPPGRYAALRLLVSGGNGDSAIPAELVYAGGAADPLTIPCDDWFHDHPPDRHGGLQRGLTPVWNGMDRIYNGRWEDAKDPALFELIIETRPDEELTALVLHPEDGIFSSRHTRFNLLAATAIGQP